MQIKRLLTAFAIITFSSVFSQEKDVFNVARKGTVAEMEQLIMIDKDTINSVNDYGFTPLILACYRGNKNLASYLIHKADNIDYVSPQGTALAASVVQNQKELVLELLEQGADINLANSKGLTPLILAIQFENVDMVKLLLAKGADKTIKDGKGIAPFEHALQTKNSEIINNLKS